MSGIIYPINDKEYTAEDVEIFNCTRTSGVYSVLDFDCSLSGNVLTVGKGLAWIKNSDFSGKAIAFKDITTITLDSADDTLDRYDVIAVRYDATKTEPELVVIKGEANESPAMPTRSTESYLYELFLYSILREAGESTVSFDNVTDLRENKNYCGIMEDSVTSAVAPVYETIVENTELEVNNVVDFNYDEYEYLIATLRMSFTDCDVILTKSNPGVGGVVDFLAFSGVGSVASSTSTFYFRAQIRLNPNSATGHLVASAQWSDNPNFTVLGDNATIVKIVGVTKQPKGYVAVDDVYNAESHNAQSGQAISMALSGVLQASKDYTRIYVEDNLGVVDVTYDPTSDNAQSGKAVAEAIAGFKGVEELSNMFEKLQSNNLLDVSTVQTGWIDNTDNKIYPDYDTYVYFEQYIPVVSGDVISLQMTLLSNNTRYWSSDLTDNILTTVTAYSSEKEVLTDLGGRYLKNYTVPTDVDYIRVTILKSILERYTDISLLKNATEIVPYEAPTKVVLKAEHNNDTHIKNLVREVTGEGVEPLTFLPEEICCAVGRTIEIYNSQVCPLADKYHVKWDCSIGRALKRKFSVTGTEALVGEYPLSVCIYDDEFNALYEKTITLKIVQGLSSVLSICTIGDSLTNGKYWLNEVRSLSSNNINFVGTRGTTDGLKHEGRSGFTSNAYLKATPYTFENEGVHPFWDSANNKFSWAYYKTNSGINPDAVQIFLGTNDLATSVTVETFASNIKQMVDSIREADTVIPIYIVLTICWGNQNGIGIQTSFDGFASQKGRFKYETDCKTIDGVQTLYNTLKEYTNLYFVPLTQCHDSEYNFGNVETPVNPRATQKELMPIEAVHPQKQGYEQIADVMYSVISAHG